MKKLIIALALFSACNNTQIQDFKAKNGTTTLIVSERLQGSTPYYHIGDTVDVDQYHWIGGYAAPIGKYVLIEKLQQH